MKRFSRIINCGGVVRPYRAVIAGSTLALGMCLTGTSPAPAFASTPTHLWSQSFGSTEFDDGRSVAVDGFGNVVVTGRFGGTVDFGGGNRTSAGLADIFLAKYDPTGTHLWSQPLGGTSWDEGYSVTVDGSANVIVTGVFQGTVDFGGGNLISAGSSDIFVAKYNPSGTHLWSRRFGGTGSDYGYAVAVDGAGNVIATGCFESAVDFGGGSLTSVGATDIYVAKYDPSGIHVWSQRFGGTGTDHGYSAVSDGFGNVIATGYFEETVDFGGGDLTSAGLADIFLTKYHPTGTHVWSRRVGDTSTDQGRSVGVDGSGNLFVTGFFRDTVNFGGGHLATAGGEDVFLAKYDASGTHLWSQRFGSSVGEDVGNSVAVDGSGNVSVTGYFVGTVDFGGGDLTGTGWSNIFVAKYDAGGTHQWSRSSGVVSLNSGNSVAIVGSGDTYVTGSFEWGADFGGGHLTSAGFSDIFLAKYGDDPVTSVDKTPTTQALSVSAYPNPFNPSTTIRYSIPFPARVTVSLYDVRGALVTTIVDEDAPTGSHAVRWNATGVSGRVMSSGVYFARILHNGSTRTTKLVFLK